MRASIFWYDAETQTEREHSAGSMSLEPVVSATQLIGLTPDKLSELIAEITPPACLRVWEAPSELTS